MSDRRLDRAARAVVRVGGGRGFVVEDPGLSRYARRLVVTAAHCLPHLPPPHLASYLSERTYRALLGPLGDAPPTVWAECLFVDPIADLAVLTSPDNQVLSAEAEAYEALVESMVPVPMRAAKQGAGWVLGLDGRWLPCAIERAGSPLWVQPVEPIAGGMSGSPVMQNGAAVGVVSVDANIRPVQAVCLALDLPRRLLPRARR